MVDVSTPSAAPPPARHRVAIPAIAIAAATLVPLVLLYLPAEQLDSGTRHVFTAIVIVVAALVVTGWFFLGSHVSRKSRLIGGVLLGLLVLCMLGAVRRVEFTGDMVPSVDFRWRADRNAVLEAHRAVAQRSATAVAPLAEVTAGEHDVFDFRGAARDGVMATPPLARDWTATPPALVWRQPVGGGYASFVVAGPLAVTIEQRRDQEAIVAYDLATGQERWVHSYPALFSEKLGGDGPRATPTIHEGSVYSLGATGVLVRLDLLTGKLAWSVNIFEQNGSTNIDWGMSGSPLVTPDLVIVNPGSQNGSETSHALLALETSDGRIRFGGGKAKAGYASPMLVTLAGARQYLIFDGVGLAGFDFQDGRELWRYPWKSEFDINASQPVLLGDDQVLISSASGTALLKITHGDDAWTPEEVWKIKKMKCRYASPIAHNGYLYGIDDTLLACVDLANGKQVWKDRAGAYGAGQILRSADLLIVMAETGELALVEATRERFHELGRVQAIEGKTWNNPTLVGNRILVRNHLEMAAYDLPVADK